MCREEGRALSELAARKDKPLDGFGLWGLVKETGVDNEGLVEFNTKYYSHPLYRDEDKVFYDALGNRKLKLLSTWNPFKIYSGIKEMGKRLKEKNIEGNFKGEGLVQGGVVIFGRDGKARYAYEEETGQELPVDDIIEAVKAVKSGKAEL